MIDEKNDDGADYRHEHRNKKAVEFVAEACQLAEKITAHHRPNQPQRGVDHETFAALVDDLAGDPAGQRPKNDPAQNEHENLSQGRVAAATSAGRPAMTHFIARHISW